ncbi:cation diffusion facilitator family transporter [Glaciecola sp. SC05]|uniref:cation diffusion facilitator family transporter n=1 Tax=Glaciecola sp. SC05 TaxID=1987355 RepID=UPI0035278C13
MNVKKVLLIEGAVNLIIALSKLSIGLLTNSAAIVADAIHSATDVVNNGIAWIATNMSEAPADNDHPYGHQKYEQLAVFVLASLLTIVAFQILISAIQRFGEPVEHSTWGLGILVGALIINILLAIWERSWAKKLHSDILNADASHTFSDVLTSVAVIVGWQVASQGWYWVDGAFAIVMAGIIFYLSYRLFQKAIPILVDYSDIDAPKIRRAICKIEGVKRVTNLRSRTLSKQRYADVVVLVDPSLSLTESHNIASAVETVLAEQFEIDDAVVHIEPFYT